MELIASGAARTSKPFEAQTPSFMSEAMNHIMLDTFEAEIDALMGLLGEKRQSAVSEALIRRYATAEEIYKDLEESYRRIEIKMVLLSDKLTENVLGEKS